MRAELCGVKIEWIEPDERSYPKDCIRVTYANGEQWLATFEELSAFTEDISEVKGEARRKEREEGRTYDYA